MTQIKSEGTKDRATRKNESQKEGSEWPLQGSARISDIYEKERDLLTSFESFRTSIILCNSVSINLYTIMMPSVSNVILIRQGLTCIDLGSVC